MSDVITAAVEALNAKMGGGLDGTAKFVFEGEGAIMIDVTLTADTETFQSIMAGDLNPTAAFMSGKLAVDGDMGMAMKLGAALA